MVDGHDVRLVQPPGGSCLPKQPLAKHLIPRILGPEQLERHHTVHHGVFGLLHLAEPTLAQQPFQPVVTEPRTRPQTRTNDAIGRLIHNTITPSAT